MAKRKVKKSYSNKVGKLSFWDMQLVKLSVIAFAFAIIGLIPGLAELVMGVNPIVWIILFIVFAIKPAFKTWK